MHHLVYGILFFNFLALFYQFFSDYPDTSMYIYTSMVIFACIGLFYSGYGVDINMDNVIKLVFFFTIFTTICGLYLTTTGLMQIIIEEQSLNGGSDFDGLTLGAHCVLNISSGLYLVFKYRNFSKLHLFYYVLIVLDLWVILLSEKRTPFIVAIFVVVYYLYANNLLKKILIAKTFFVFIFIVVSFFLFVLLNDDLFELVNKMFDNIVSGLTDLFSGTNSLDITNSSSIRYYNRQKALDILANFELYQYIVGAGFMTFWSDIPLLHSYMDMGIIGFMLFGYYNVLLPIKIIRRYKNKIDPILLWAVTHSLYNVFACLTSGHAYGHAKWIPIILLVFVYLGTKKRNNIINDCICN